MAEPPSFEYVSPPDAKSETAPPRRVLGVPAFALGLAGGALVLLLAGAAAVTVFILAAGHGTVLDRMVPADAVAYASANLDPPADQKLDLLNLSHKLPKLSTEQNLDQSLNDALKPLGLSYSGDVKPWLGAQIVALGGPGSKPDGAALFDSKNDSAAQQALAKLESKYSDAGWQTRSHGGVTLKVGTHSKQTVVLAYFDHTLLAASSEALADEIIDTDQGKHARLDSTSEYHTVTSRLPSSRLLTVFVDGSGLSGWTQGMLKSFAGTVPSFNTSQITESVAAYRGFGFAVAARGDGLVADAETDVDTSKLTADQRAIYDRTGPNAALRHVPPGAVAVAGVTDLDLIFKSIVGQPATSTVLPPQVREIVSKLSGDAAVEVEPDGQSFAVGAVIGTTDPDGLRATLRQLAGDGLTSTYFATSGGDVLVATSPAELQRLESPNAGFASTSGYGQAASYAVANPTTVVYVDVDGAFRLADTLSGLHGSSDFQQARHDWSALHSVLVTVGPSSARFHFLIG